MNMVTDNVTINGRRHSSASEASCETGPINGQCGVTVNVRTEVEVEINEPGLCDRKCNAGKEENEKEASRKSSRKNREKALQESNLIDRSYRIPADEETVQAFRVLAKAARDGKVTHLEIARLAAGNEPQSAARPELETVHRGKLSYTLAKIIDFMRWLIGTFSGSK